MKKNVINQPTGAIKKKVLDTVNLMEDKLLSQGVSVIGHKIVFDGEFFRITIRTPKGTRFARFVELMFVDDDAMTIVAKEYTINNCINKLIQLNKT